MPDHHSVDKLLQVVAAETGRAPEEIEAEAAEVEIEAPADAEWEYLDEE